MTQERLWDVKEVAEYLKLDEQTIYRKVDRNTIPHKRIGLTIRFNKEEIDQWLKKNSRGIREG